MTTIEGRTKLKSTAAPFRPITNSPCLTAASLSSVQSSSTHSLTAAPLSSIPSQGGPYGEYAPWTALGYLEKCLLATADLHTARPESHPRSSTDCQGSAFAPSAPVKPPEFKLGNFRTELIKRSQNPLDPDSSTKMLWSDTTDAEDSVDAEIMLAQALMYEAEQALEQAAKRKATGLQMFGSLDRLSAMKHCMQTLKAAQVRSMQHSSDHTAPLQHASTFMEGAQLPSQGMPVKRTFIHYGDHPESAFQYASSPAIMMNKEFHTTSSETPSMDAKEAAHKSGECKPCVYFIKKKDGCRLGTACSFCHLCCLDSIHKKRKDKMKAFKALKWQEGPRPAWSDWNTLVSRDRAYDWGSKQTTGKP